MAAAYTAKSRANRNGYLNMGFSSFANDYGGQFIPDPHHFESRHAKRFCQSLNNVLSEFLEFSEFLSNDFKKRGFRGIELEAGYLIGKTSWSKQKLINAYSRSRSGKDYVGIQINLAASVWKMIAGLIEKGMLDFILYGEYNKNTPSFYNTPLVDIHCEKELGLKILDDDLSDYEFEIIELVFEYAIQWIFQH